ncbi:GNAT family N-acetyltransferase [Microtetraspora glauca]|uniref:GNAT family N-acetyltransferase n=1 Tax=Microtetraspora glauca TaxID=1996 RepID=A0ABV3GJL0_MICGL
MTIAAELTMRPYSDADLPLLQRTFAEWIAVAGRCGYDHIGELPHRIYENLRGRRPVGELVHVWEHGGAIAGLAVNLRFGSAFDVFTAPSLRGTPAELEMLRVAYKTTGRLMGRDEPFVLTDLFDCDTTRAELLTRLGFARFRTWDHVNERDLAGPLAEPVPPGGFVLREARPEDAEQLAVARNHSFDEDWTGDLYRSAVMEKPGYDPGREIVAESPDGRIAAFTVYWTDDRNRIGHFEPVGTHREFQRMGLARAAMLYAMRRMAERGMTTVTVNHNAENLPAAGLYASLGFVRRHETYGFRKPY